MTTSDDYCPCGKPRAHLDADPDSDAWACRVPGVIADARDLTVHEGGRDPYMDACPSWCESAATGHHFVCSESERKHYGADYSVPVRSLAAMSGTLGHLAMYLQRPALQREPQVHVIVMDGDERAGAEGDAPAYDLTIDEAEALAGALLELVRTARSA